MGKFSSLRMKRKLYYRFPGRLAAKLLLVCVLLGSFTIPTPETQEYSIKAAFIYKFTNYIDWPSHLPGNEFVIGIIGQSPITGALETIANTKTVKDKKIVIRKYEN